jgi:putative transposase
MRKVKFGCGEYYHIYNRGVEKRDIFLEDEDYQRFLLSLKVFNSYEKVHNLRRDFALFATEPRTEAESLVKAVCYCLMSNHFHLILRQEKENGISKYMQKVGTGYTQYFNSKYQRQGVLFQGAFKAIHIENDSYLLHLSRYIHLNPFDIYQPDWKENGIKNFKGAFDFISKYKWSSFQFYLDPNKQSMIKLEKDIILSQFKDTSAYRDFMMKWIKDDLNSISNLLLEKA